MHGHFYGVDDFVEGTITITGDQEVANRNGHGVVIQDTGRVVLDLATGDLMSFAGGRSTASGCSATGSGVTS